MIHSIVFFIYNFIFFLIRTRKTRFFKNFFKFIFIFYFLVTREMKILILLTFNNKNISLSFSSRNKLNMTKDNTEIPVLLNLDQFLLKIKYILIRFFFSWINVSFGLWEIFILRALLDLDQTSLKKKFELRSN